MANGFFVLGLIAAQLFPLDALQLDSAVHQEWAVHFDNCRSLHIGLPSPGLPAAYWPKLPVLLQIITRCDMTTLRKDTHAVTVAMRVTGIFNQRIVESI